jgi:hypothetical protein
MDKNLLIYFTGSTIPRRDVGGETKIACLFIIYLVVLNFLLRDTLNLFQPPPLPLLDIAGADKHMQMANIHGHGDPFGVHQKSKYIFFFLCRYSMQIAISVATRIHLRL